MKAFNLPPGVTLRDIDPPQEPMKFIIKCPIKEVSGYQYFSVEAKSEEEALEMYYGGQASFEEEEIEVKSVGEPEVIAE